MMDKLKYYWHTITDKYVVQVNYVEIPEPGHIPELVEKKYIVLDDKNQLSDYTSEIQKASVFGIVLGGIVVKKLRRECKDLPNLQFELVSVGDAHFIDTVTTGAKTPYNNFMKGPIDFAADDLHLKYLQLPDVLGTGVAAEMNTEKRALQEWLEIHVKNEATKKLIQKEFPDNMYQGFPLKIVIASQIVPQEKEVA